MSKNKEMETALRRHEIIAPLLVSGLDDYLLKFKKEIVMKSFDECGKLTKKCLPVRYPIITTYTQHAHLLSILTSYEQSYPWIFSNYIQLYINKDYNKHSWGDFYFPFPYELRPSDTCKWILSQKLHRSVIERKWGSIIDFVIDSINSNNYVHTMFNNFYLPKTTFYKKINFNHDLFIYGYDTDQEILYISEFFNGWKYSFEQISFSDFIQGFSTYDLPTNADYLNETIYLYKFNEGCDYEFSIENIINSIKSYLSCNTPEYWDMYNRKNRENIVFGMDIYTTLKNYISQSISGDGANPDIRPFYMLYDHKALMCLRFKYLHEQGYFREQNNESNILALNKIESQVKNLMNLLMKASFSESSTIKEKAISKLCEIEKEEYDILKQYIS